MNQDWKQLVLVSDFAWKIVVLLHTVDIVNTFFLIISTVLFLTILNAFLKANSYGIDALFNESNNRLFKWGNYLAIVVVLSILVTFDVTAFLRVNGDRLD